ncbi:MAG: T9SS type A sorting domain-containing protein [Bacteroidota bacterium]
MKAMLPSRLWAGLCVVLALCSTTAVQAQVDRSFDRVALERAAAEENLRTHYAGPQADTFAVDLDLHRLFPEAAGGEVRKGIRMAPTFPATLNGGCRVYTNRELRSRTHVRPDPNDPTKAIATIDLPHDACTSTISFSTYLLPEGNIRPFDQQELFDNNTYRLGPGHHTLHADLPTCGWQADVYYGPVIAALDRNHGHPGNLIINWDFDEGVSCGTGGDLVCVEAEDGQFGAHTLLNIKSDADASGGQYIEVAQGNNTLNTPPGANGRVSYDLTVSEGGQYRLWGRTLTRNSGDNSFWVRVDGGDWVRWNTLPSSNAWTWNQVKDSDFSGLPVVFDLAPGTSTVEIAYREDGAQLDRLLLTNDTVVIPEGTGDAVCGSTDPCIVDAGAPSINIVQVTDPAGVVTGFEVEVTDDTGLASVDFSNLNNVTVSSGTLTPGATSVVYTLTVDNPALDASFDVEALDECQKRTSEGGSSAGEPCILDGGAPTITITPVVDGDGVTTGFTVEVTDDTGLASVDFPVQNNVTETGRTFTPGATSATFTFVVDNPALDANLEVTATDECQKQDTESKGSSGEPCILDGGAPTITITPVVDGDGVTTGFTVEVTDDTGLASVDFSNLVNVTQSSGTLTPGAMAATFEFTIDDASQDASFDVEALDECQKSASESSGSTGDPCILDAGPPELTYTAENAGTDLFINLVITDDTALDEVTVNADSNLELVNSTSTPQEQTFRYRIIDITKNSVITATATDECGKNACVDTEAPLITLEVNVEEIFDENGQPVPDPTDPSKPLVISGRGQATDNVSVTQLDFIVMDNLRFLLLDQDPIVVVNPPPVQQVPAAFLNRQTVPFAFQLVNPRQGGAGGLMAVDECNAFIFDPPVPALEDETAPPAEPILVNFQKRRSDTPSGYLADWGLTFGDRGNGYEYGWDERNTRGRERDHARAPDQRYDTLILLQRQEQDHVWEIAVPNGTYEVNFVAGDPRTRNQINTFDVEGVRVVDPDGKDHFDEHTLEVMVADGRLTVQPGEGAHRAKLAFIEITPLSGGGVIAKADAVADTVADLQADGLATASADLIDAPESFELHQNYPNPFNPTTTISFDLPDTAPVTLKVYDLMGREVITLVDGVMDAGVHEVYFDAGTLASGTYLYRLTTPQQAFVKQMMLVK